MLIKHVIQIEFETFQVIRSVFVSTFILDIHYECVYVCVLVPHYLTLTQYQYSCLTIRNMTKYFISFPYTNAHTVRFEKLFGTILLLITERNLITHIEPSYRAAAAACVHNFWMI